MKQNNVPSLKSDNLKNVHYIVTNDENMQDWAKQSVKFAEYLKQEKERLTK